MNAGRCEGQGLKSRRPAVALQMSYGDLAEEKQMVGEGYLGRNWGRQGERIFWASIETPCSQKRTYLHFPADPSVQGYVFFFNP